MVKASELRLEGRWLDFQSFRCQEITLGKLFTYMCLCHEAVQFCKGLNAGKVTVVCGRGVAYRPHNWAVSAAHCGLGA